MQFCDDFGIHLFVDADFLNLVCIKKSYILYFLQICEQFLEVKRLQASACLLVFLSCVAGLDEVFKW